ncbi:MAG: ABC transporter [Flavobacterium sp. BFFFF2]|nr:MAG: ABC transporter [Flavobacterium sp. BFFFF2]
MAIICFLLRAKFIFFYAHFIGFMENILEVDSINKSFGEKKILTDVFLRCEVGDVIGVFGSNGSGKSTLLKIIYGTLQAENKFIRLNNKVTNEAYKIKNGIAYLPQQHFIPTNLTVQKVITLSINPNKKDEFLRDAMINSIIDSKIGSLSGGELKYLHVKLILFSEAHFCLLDEPYSGISPIIAALINHQIAAQSKTKGIIIADHHYAYLLEIATKLYLLKDGVGKFIQHQAELITSGYLKKGMLTE